MILPRFPSSGDTIFTVMSGLANQYGAINLSQGFPDFPIDPEWEHRIAEAVRQGYNQYAPMPGMQSLRQAIAGKISHFQQVQADPGSEITITPGATYAIYVAFTTLLQPGDEAIVLEPAYDSYIPNIRINGALPVCIPLDARNGFRPDWSEIAAAITSRTRVIIINNPNNPTGAIWRAEDYHELSRLVTQHDLYIIADEVYEHLVYDKAEHISVLRFPGLRSRSFVVFSFGKVLHSTGWKMGYIVAPPMLTKAFRQIHQYLAFSVNTPMQHAIAGYLDQYDKLEVSRTLMEQKRDLFLDGMKDTKFTCLNKAEGSYFQVMDYSAVSDLPDKEFASWLTREHGVAGIPVSSFYSTEQSLRLIRFCFAKKQETLQAAIGKLKKV